MYTQGAKVTLSIAIKYKLIEVVLGIENKDHWGADIWVQKSNNCDDWKSGNHCYTAELPSALREPH